MVNHDVYRLALGVQNGNKDNELILEDLGRNGYIVAVDFDGTLCENSWPKIGKPMNTVELVRIIQRFGIRTILWTCREGASLVHAKEWLAHQGLFFDAYNENLPEEIFKWHSNPRKVGADEFWDDKNIVLKECERRSDKDA